MSFFGKLKAKLFKSSKRLDSGINELVEKDDNKILGVKEGESVKANHSFRDKNITETILKRNENPGIQESKKVSTKKGILKRIVEPVTKLVRRRRIDGELLDSLEDLLISADLGITTAAEVSSRLSGKYANQEVSSDEIKRLLSEVIEEILDPVAKPLELSSEETEVILVVGVNGSGKTTTIGKLADKYKKLNKSVMVAACDTYRAAAVEQLSIWGERAGVPVIFGKEGADPAALAFEAHQKATEEGIDILMVDTAGRLQNKLDLMSELEKIIRVLRKRNTYAPHHRLIVLDASTGQNAISQVSEFSKFCDLTGIIMTKLDGTARGGVLVALAEKFSLPVHFIGVGESIDDLQPFTPKDFANAITGISRTDSV